MWLAGVVFVEMAGSVLVGEDEQGVDSVDAAVGLEGVVDGVFVTEKLPEAPSVVFATSPLRGDVASTLLERSLE